MQNDVKTSWGSFDHGRKSVGTAVEAIGGDISCKRGVLVKAGGSNGDTVYIGNSDMTVDSAEDTDGYELSAGQSVTINVSNVNKVYARSKTLSGQSVYWVCV